MIINGSHMDDARFKTLVDILMGRTSICISAEDARRAATEIAISAVTDIMEWSDRYQNEGVKGRN